MLKWIENSTGCFDDRAHSHTEADQVKKHDHLSAGSHLQILHDSLLSAATGSRALLQALKCTSDSRARARDQRRDHWIPRSPPEVTRRGGNKVAVFGALPSTRPFPIESHWTC